MFCRAVGVFHFDALGDILFSNNALFHLPFKCICAVFLVLEAGSFFHADLKSITSLK